MGTLLDRVRRQVPGWVREFVGFQARLGEAVRRGILRQGLSQGEFARRHELKPSQLSRIVAGNANLTLKTIFRLQDMLGEPLIRLSEVAEAKPAGVVVRFVSAEDTNRSAPAVPEGNIVRVELKPVRVASTSTTAGS